MVWNCTYFDSCRYPMGQGLDVKHDRKYHCKYVIMAIFE